MTDHPITPPRELKQQWREQAPRYRDGGVGREEWLMDRSAQWGYEQRGEVNEAKPQQARDQELNACCDWLRHEVDYGYDLALKLRAARRPKPPSLKEQALALIDDCTDPHGDYLDDNALSTIRRALEALPDD